MLLTVAAAAGEPVQLGWRAPVTGDQVWMTHHTVAELPLQVDLGDRQHPTALFREHTQRVLYTVEASGPHPTRLSIAWAESRLRDSGPDGSRDLQLPVSGKTYVVDLTTSTVASTWSTAETDTALAASDLFVLLKGIRDMLGDAPLSPGDTRPAGFLFAGLVRDAPGTPTVVGTLTVLDTRLVAGETLLVVRIEVQLEASGPLESGVNARMHADLSGELLLDPASGWTRSLHVSGPVKLEGEGQRFGKAFTLSGTGRFESRTQLSITPPSPPPQAHR